MGMKNRFQEAVQNVQRQRHLARRSLAMVLVLAMLTSMSVSWRLHQDGIALTADDTRYYCGKEEHKHTDDCYIEGTEPVCGYEEGEIVEEAMDLSDDAWDADPSVADWDEAGSEPESEPATQEEPEPEVVLHHHTSDCYEEEEVLTCGIESDHVHQDYCYDQETGELLCTEHEHTDDCYTLEEVLVCGQEEGEPEETDDGIALYDMDENSAEESDSAEEPVTVADPEPEKEATKPETNDKIDTGYTVHHHTDECYGKVLICGKEEHEHTADCLVNPNAKIDAEYDAKTPDRTSMDWAEDMVLVAQSQLGYTESKADVDEDGNGYTMYADQYYKDKPMVYADWDSTFVAYCLYHAGVPQDIIPQYASISALRGELARMNSEYYTDDPQRFASILPGDIVMYKNTEGRETIGVVSDAAVDEETDLTTALTVISGDVATGYESDGETTIDQVAEVSVALSDVTSFVSVNAAEGYGVDDLMDDDVAVQDMADAELLEALEKATDFGQYIPESGIHASNTELITDTKESYRSQIEINFKVPQDIAKDFVSNEYAYKIDLNDIGLDPRYMTTLLNGEHPLKSGNSSIGKYRFVQVPKEDGTYTYSVLLQFNEDYLKKNPVIDGNIKFWGEIGTEHGNKEGSVEIKLNDKITLKIPESEITYPADKTNAYDIKTSKDGSYDPKTNELTYKVKIVSEKGTPDVVNYKDAITGLNGLTLGEPTITVKKCAVTENRTNKDSGWSQASSTEWEMVTGHTLTGTASGEISGTLPQMETSVSESGLERTHTEYEVTYVYKVSDMKNVNYQLENKVGVSSSTKTNLTIEGTDTAKVPLNNEYTITKTAGDYANGKIKWTITLNSNELDITNAVLKDTMVAGNTTIADVLAKASDITINPNSGFEYIDTDEAVTTDPSKRVGIRFTEIDGQPNNKKYTIVYYTSHEQSDNKYTVNNTATLEPDGSDAVTTGPIGKDVNPIFYTKKALPNEVKIEDGKMIIPWESSVDFSNTDKIEKGTRFYDSFVVAGANKEHAMTPEQARAMTIEWVDSKGNSYGRLDKASYELTFIKEATTNNDTGITSGTTADLENPNEKIHGYKIEFITDVSRPANATVVRIKYSSTVNASEIQEGDSFRNLFKINDFQRWERWSYTPGFPKITKMDGEGRTGTTTVVSEDDTITWKIKIHTNGFLNGSVTVHDDLPAGVVVESVELKDHNGSISVTPDVQFGGKWNNDILTGIYNKNKNTLEMTLSNEHYLMRNADYVFIIKCKAVSDPKDGTTAIVPGKSYEYTNKASAWFDSNKDAPIGGSSQTQNWSEKDNTPVIKPIGKDVQTDASGQTLNYTVTINPEGKKLLENSTEGLKIKDKLSVQVHPDYVILNNNGTGDAKLVTVSAELDEKNVKLYYAVKNSTGELESTGRQVEGCKMTLESYLDPEHPERMLYIIHLTDVPDDEPLILRYTYTLVSDIDVHYESQWKSYGYWETHGVQNTVELEGTSYETKLEPTATDYAYSGTSGNVMSTYFLTLKKVAKGDYTTLLPGAVFQLQKYENGTFSDVGDKTYTTDDSGTITIQQGKAESEFKFDTNTLYRLVESIPPTGYALPKYPEEGAVYFYFKDDTDSAHTLPAIEEMDQVVDLNSQSKQFYVENEPNLTSVTVEKKWQKSDGTKLDNPPVSSIDFDLVQLASSIPPVSSRKGIVDGTITGSGEVKYTFDNTVQHPEGTVLTLKITYRSANNIQYNKDNLTPNIFWNGEKLIPTEEKPGDGSITWIYTCTLQEGTNEIAGIIGNYDHQIMTPEFTDPQSPTNFMEVSKTKYSLTAVNNWRMVIDNLPRSNTEGTEYYSYKIVEKTSPGDEYTVTYNTESGVVGGYLVMVNSKKPDKPDEPVYELPSTGSPGGTVPYTAGGAAIALAAVLCGYNSRRKRKRGEE